MRGSVAPLCAAVWLMLASPAFAQGDKAAAVLLYDEAGRLASAGKLGDACAKYAESYRLDQQLGTLLHLGDCYEKNGQTASAWASYREAAELAGNRNDPREKVARKRAAALESHVPKLLIEVSKSMQSAGVRVERDGNLVGAGAWGIAVPTDPGAHQITASAQGRISWSETVSVPATGSVRIAVPELAAAPTSVTPSAAASNAGNADSGSVNTATPIQPAGQPVETDAPSNGTGQRIAGYVLLGVGAVGVGVGTYFITRYFDRLNAAKAVCPDPYAIPACSKREQEDHAQLNSETKSASLASVIGFAAGGAAAIGGLVLVLTAPSSSKQTIGLTPAFYPGGGGGVLSGTF
jgi:hypothetical protein